MPRVQLDLMGPGSLRVDGRPVRWRSAKALALSAYLAVECGRSHARRRLAGLLWPDGTPAGAAHNLRQTLHWLRRVEGGALVPAVEITRDSVCWRPHPDVDVDVGPVLSGAARLHPVPALRSLDDDLLAGRDFDDLPEFGDWLNARRNQIRVALGAIRGDPRAGFATEPAGARREVTTGPPSADDPWPLAVGPLDDTNEARTVEALRAAARRAEGVQAFASALHNLAEITRDAGSPAAAIRLFENAHDLHWSAGSHQGMVLTLFGMGHAWQMLGDSAAAARRFEQAAAQALQDGEQTMIGRAEHALAMHCRETGDLDRAIRIMQRVIARDRAINYAHALGHDLVDMARLHVQRGELIQAGAALDEAAVWFDTLEDRASIATVRRMREALLAGRTSELDGIATRAFARSALPLAEGKVYCMFEVRRLEA